MAFPERDRWRAAAARKERVWGERILTEGEGEGRKERGKKQREISLDTSCHPLDLSWDPGTQGNYLRDNNE